MADTIDNDDDDDLAEKRSLLTGALRTLLLFSVVLIGVSTAPATAALFAVVVVVVVVVVIFWGVRLAISRYISAERPQNSSLPVRLFTLTLLLLGCLPHVVAVAAPTPPAPMMIVFFGELPPPIDGGSSVEDRGGLLQHVLGRWCIIWLRW
jgi:hypothetical protein